MSIPALIFLAILYRNVKVVDQTYQVPPNNWRYIDSADWRFPELDWRNTPAIVRASFVVEAGAPVRLMLIDRAGLEQLKRGDAPVPLRETTSATAGMVVQRSGSPNDSILVIENRGSPVTSVVRLVVTLDSWEAAELSPERKLAVLVVSFCVFFGMVGYAGAKLWRAQVR